MSLDRSFINLKSKQREIRESFPVNLGLRMHRALSWLDRAEQEVDDDDAAFIFYWISFNSVYAEDSTENGTLNERSMFDEFFKTIISVDADDEIYNAIWNKFSDSIRVLLNNEYVFQPFWRHQNNVAGYEDWEVSFEQSKKKIQKALSEKNTKLILTTLYDRLYVLRNQLVHGGATWNGGVNRAQVSDGAKIMAFLVPILIDLMMDHPELEWGAPYYPVVE
jgi:hypothetical protein